MSKKKSTEARTIGNSFYEKAFKEGLAPILKYERLEKAMLCYIQALVEGRGNNDLEASAAKNYAKTTWAFAKININLKQIAYYYKEAITHFGLGIACGEQGKGEEWVQNLKESYRCCLDDAINSVNASGYRNRCEAISYYIRIMDGDLYKTEMYEELARLMFNQGVSALDQGDYKNSMYAFKECYTPVEEMKRLGREREDILTEAMVLEDDLILHMASAESLQAIAIGDSLLKDVLANEESLNMNMIFEVIDWYRQAVILGSGIEVEREAMANSRLGKLYCEVLKMKLRGKEYLQQSIQLALSLKPRNFATEEWFSYAAATVQKIQEESLLAKEENEQQKKQKYLDELKSERENIKKNIPTSSDNHYKFVIFIYKTFPPKNSQHKPPDEKEMKKMNQKDMKKVFQTAVIHYHPDKVDEEKDGMKWKVLCEEITKEFTRIYECYKLG